MSDYCALGCLAAIVHRGLLSALDSHIWFAFKQWSFLHLNHLADRWLASLASGQGQNSTIQISFNVFHIYSLGVDGEGSDELGFATGSLALASDAKDIVFDLDLQILGHDTWDVNRECDGILSLVEMVVSVVEACAMCRIAGAEELVKEGIATEKSHDEKCSQVF